MNGTDDEGTKNPGSHVRMDKDQSYELLRIKVLQNLQDAMMMWVKKRFWWAVLLVAIVGYLSVDATIALTIHGLVQEPAEKAEKELKDSMNAANAAAKGARLSAFEAEERLVEVRETLSNVKDSAKDLKETVNEHVRLKESVANLVVQEQQIRTRLSHIDEKLALQVRNESARSDLAYRRLAARLQGVEDLVNTLLVTASADTPEIRGLRARIATVRAEGNAAAENFKENARYQILIEWLADNAAAALVEEYLSNVGYKTSTRKGDFPFFDNRRVLYARSGTIELATEIAERLNQELETGVLKVDKAPEFIEASTTADFVIYLPDESGDTSD